MAQDTAIQWTDHTFNPWRGCSKVAEGCKFCYAESNYYVKMHGIEWGPNGNRVMTSPAYWKHPLKWNRDAARDGVRRRVFCASLADVFEDWNGEVINYKGRALFIPDKAGNPPYDDDERNAFASLTIDDIRRDLFALIDVTPHLDWLLLTKRPENIRRMWPPRETCDCDRILYDEPHAPTCPARRIHRTNVWLGTSISTQKDADKNIPELLKCRDLSPVLFVSAEPLLGPVDLHKIPDMHSPHKARKIGWVIIGGESGPNARPCRPEWIYSLLRQCKDAGMATFVKQMGANIITRNDQVEDVFNNGESGWPDPDVEHDINGFRENYQGADCRIRLRDPKGGDQSEWPEDLRVREFP